MADSNKSDEENFFLQRESMVENQLHRRGISDERVLSAMRQVPREKFVPKDSRRLAYTDAPLGINCEQTISQPWIVAAICQALELKGNEKVLEIGTGSGYSAAVLALLAQEVITIERHKELAEGAEKTLDSLETKNIRVLTGDGSKGHAPEAPFDAIAVHAAAPKAPNSLLAQLADGGRLVIPVKGKRHDTLTLFIRQGSKTLSEEIIGCYFVPLIGEEAFDQSYEKL